MTNGTPTNLSDAIQNGIDKQAINPELDLVEAIRRQVQDYLAQQFSKKILRNQNQETELLDLFTKSVRGRE